jgi:hypothetical protein
MESKQEAAMRYQIDLANGIKQEPSLLELKKALIKARDALESSLMGGNFKHPQIRKDMQEALTAINEVLS